MSGAPPKLGPFEVMAAIARGGMGEVFRARHPAQGLSVAIKVLTASHSRREDYVAHFRDEVRAVAALDHPGVVMVLDHGAVDAEAAARSEGRLVEGSPWLAMELASGGTLAGVGSLPWPKLRSVVLSILDALAHAHARGVVHRDLKPSNVLIATAHDLRPGLKLSDFGVAHAIGADSFEGIVEPKVLGTPMYMAPEQIRGEWRDYGPWTDLYALGGLIYKLTTGEPLFPHRTQRAMVVAHLHERPRPLVPDKPYPEGFTEWVGRLVAKDPRARFRRAADAAYALARLDRDVQSTTTIDFDGVSGWSMPSGTRASSTMLLDTLIAAVAGETTSDHGADPGARPVAPPVPRRWQRRVPEPTPAPLVGAGLGLYGLRSVPLLGRESERDVLWSALREVADSGTARLVLLRGPAGTGKSRMARWLCRRAHEVGAANVGHTVFTPNLSPGEGLQRFGAGYLRTANLDRPLVEERVTTFVRGHGGGDDEARVLTELMCPATPRDIAAGVQPVRLTKPVEYYTATRDAMFRLAQERPLVAWFDDVQYGLHGLGLARRVLQTQDVKPFPVLLLMTLRDEEAQRRPAEMHRLTQVMDLEGATEIRIGPLSRGEHARLVRGLLRLDDTLAATVEERTDGNPLFAVHLVGDWVQRDLLELGAGGFRLRPGADPALPDDVHHLWRQRVDEVVGEFPDPEQALRYIEIAAVLGREVQWAEWKRACDDPEGLFGARFPGDDALRARLVERLFADRLATGDRRRWNFVHGMLKESLLRSAAEGGRLHEHHLACAAMLGGRKDPLVAERRGCHLLAGGRPADAIAPLLQAVAVRLAAFGPMPALPIVHRAAQGVREAGLPDADPRRGHLMLARGAVSQARGDLDRAAEHIAGALRGAERHGWRDVEALARSRHADLLRVQGRVVEAEAQYGLLATSTGRAGAAARLGIARLAMERGDYVGARAQASAALAGLERPEDALDRARCQEILGGCAVGTGRVDDAMGHFVEAMGLYERYGGGLGMARSLRAAADLDARSGRPDEALDRLARAASRFAVLGSSHTLDCTLQLAILRACHGHVPAALAALASVRGLLAELPIGSRIAASALVEVIESEEDDGSWEPALQRADQVDDPTGVVARLARLGTELRRRATQPSSAGRIE